MRPHSRRGIRHHAQNALGLLLPSSRTKVGGSTRLGLRRGFDGISRKAWIWRILCIGLRRRRGVRLLGLRWLPGISGHLRRLLTEKKSCKQKKC